MDENFVSNEQNVWNENPAKVMVDVNIFAVYSRMSTKRNLERFHHLLSCEYESYVLPNTNAGTAKGHGKNYIKVRSPSSAIFCVIVYRKPRHNLQTNHLVLTLIPHNYNLRIDRGKYNKICLKSRILNFLHPYGLQQICSDFYPGFEKEVLTCPQISKTTT